MEFIVIFFLNSTIYISRYVFLNKVLGVQSDSEEEDTGKNNLSNDNDEDRDFTVAESITDKPHELHKSLSYSEAVQDLWILVNYEGEFFLGIILETYDVTKSVKVWCLEKPYGINILQDLEKERYAVVYNEEQLFKAPVEPKLVKSLRTWKYI